MREAALPTEKTAIRKVELMKVRTAVGTTPPALRRPDTSDGVPAEASDDYAWLDRIDLD
jgi:hypothetical protein